MKKVYIFFLLVLTCVFIAPAQGRQEKRKNHEQMRREFLDFKMKFMAQEMDLKPEQQQKFFELYEKMEGERMQIFKETRSIEKKVKKNKDATDADYDALNKAMDEAREKNSKIDKKYEEQFATFLSSKQVYKMRNAEEKFRKKMRDMRKNKTEKR